MPKFARQTAMTVALIVAAAYLIYRGVFTLNLETTYSSFASLALYLAEIYGVFLMSLFFYQIWDTSEPAEQAALEGRTVDVLVPTYNEDIDMLRATLLAARDMEYPHNTYVLDDGRRPEVEALAAELGIGYFARDNNLHAKAGNLNHALEKTDGEFVIIFDADHIAKPQFINRTIGYFAEEDLGFVQTPHAFYNFDSFPARVNYKKRTYWEEGQLFYNVIQAGKNHWNAVVFCGSAAIFRREALESVGLIATETITEDMHTGMRMHAEGWRSYFVNERLIAGQAAPDSTTSQSQRLRWGEGNLSIFAHDNPLTMKGLSWSQRVNYLGSMISWTAGCMRAVIYATPILMLFTGVAPVTNFGWLLGGLIALYLGTSWGAIKIAGNGYGNLWRTEVASMADFWTNCRSTYRAMLRRSRQRFVVTSKRGRQSGRWLGSIAPQVTVAALGFAALGWAIMRYATGVSDDLLGLAIGGVLVALQALLAFAVLRHAMRSTPSKVIKYPTSGIHVRYKHTANDGVVTEGQAITVDISEWGLGVIAYQELPMQQLLELTIDCAGRHIKCEGRVRNSRRQVELHSARDGDIVAHRYGIELSRDGLSDKERGAIENQLLELGMNYAVQRWYQRFGLERVPAMIDKAIMSDTLSRSAKRARLPLEIAEANAANPKWRGAVTEQVSDLEIKFLLEHAHPIGTPLKIRIESPTGKINGAAKVLGVTERMLGRQTLYLHHLQLTQFEDQGRGHLQALLSSMSNRKVRNSVNPTPEIVKRPIARPLTTVAVPALAATAVLAFAQGFVYQDDLLITRVARSGEATPEEADKVREIYNDAIDSGTLDAGRLQKLHDAMSAIGEFDSGASVVEHMLVQSPNNRELRFARAVHYEEEGREVEAYEELTQLIDEMPESPRLLSATDAEYRERVLLQAARNAANREEIEAAIEHFEAVDPAQSDDAGLRQEYSGLLVSIGRDQEAEEILKKTELSIDGKMLLTSIYTSREDFDSAADVLLAVLEEQPGEPKATEMLADIYSWQGRGAEAAQLYEGLLAERPGDLALHAKAGRAYLWSRMYPEALAHFDALGDMAEADDRLKIEYLDAIAGSDEINDAAQRQLMAIHAAYVATPRESRPDSIHAALIRSMAAHHRSYELVALMQTSLAKDPANFGLREQLADLLDGLGEHELAAQHYESLIRQASTDGPSAIGGPTAGFTGSGR